MAYRPATWNDALLFSLVGYPCPQATGYTLALIMKVVSAVSLSGL
jgi:hypothetical protein|tara:strand:- start:1944 stop:2078 length:135 start_codon:yes stop_codon:yes gene_type:complete